MRRRRGAWSDRDGMDKRRGHVTDADPSTSPVPIAQRVAAVADAGYTGLGLIADDVAVIRDNVGFDGLRNLLTDHGLTHIEIELIERWWIPRGEPDTLTTSATCCSTPPTHSRPRSSRSFHKTGLRPPTPR